MERAKEIDEVRFLCNLYSCEIYSKRLSHIYGRVRENMDEIVYELGDSLYINLTNRCSNACSFCVRNNCDGVGGHNLWLEREPSAQEVIEAIGDPTQYREIVFCGYGEPMIKLDEIIEISKYVKKKGIKTRINTNGQANLIHGCKTVGRLRGLIDTVSISLNASNAKQYQEICQSDYGEKAYEAVLEFARECVGVIPRVILTVVNILSEEEIQNCRKIAQEIGADFRVRDYME